MFPAMISTLFATSTSRPAYATDPTCHDYLCASPDCLIHGLRRPSAVVTPTPRRATTGELPYANGPASGTDNVWTNIVLTSPPPAYTITSLDGTTDNTTMSGALDASAMEKGYQGGQKIYATPDSIIGMPMYAVDDRQSGKRDKRRIIKWLCAIILAQFIIGVIIGVVLAVVNRD